MHETFPFAILALIGVFLAAGGLIAASISRAVYQGFRAAAPLMAVAALYGVAFLVKAPAPLQAVVNGSGLTMWDALRYGALGVGFALVALDYFKALCQLHEYRQGRGEV